MDWPHAPLHRFDAEGIYFVTGSTYLKQHLFRTEERLDWLQDLLFMLARRHACDLEAWCLFSNHYHLVVRGAGVAVRRMLSELHSIAAIECNRWDEAAGRRVWYQFRETILTYERSWLARLRYTHENAVHHGLVRVAANYPWCSARWFERTASLAFQRSVARFQIDRVHVPDAFDVKLPDGPQN